jgi:hypothetical protein
MVVSDPAMMFYEERREGFFRRLMMSFGFGRRQEAPIIPDLTNDFELDRPIEAEPAVVEAAPLLAVAAEAAPIVEKVTDTTARVITLTPTERRARAIALRGLAQARGQRYEAAFASFLEATSMDVTIDFAKLPDFWKLPREAHQAAIEAYERVGRRRDAAQLTALVRETFRPKVVKARSTLMEPILREA